MARDWEATFRSWTARSSDHEQEMSEHAESMIRKAIKAYEPFQELDIKIIPQGSYANNTNVRLASDVDICVCNMDTINVKYGKSGLDDSVTGLKPATYTFDEFKDDVVKALENYFDEDKVERGNKAIDVHSTSYRLDADVLPCLEHRRYQGPSKRDYISGIWFWSDDGHGTVNFPIQHQENGNAKNTRTRRRFKRVVRILKRLRNEMEDEGIESAEEMSSYLLECLVWNVPDEYLMRDEYVEVMRGVLAFLFNNTRSYARCEEWGEVSELHYIFTKKTRSKREAVNKFMDDAWDYVGYE